MEQANRIGRITSVFILGGLLWIVFGIFEMLTPWGTAQVYQAHLGYEAVINIALFRLYHLPGSSALVLCALGLLRLSVSYAQLRPRLQSFSQFFAYLTIALGSLSMLGLLLPLAPLTVAGLSFGRLTLALALVSFGATAWGKDQPLSSGFVLLGCIGLVLLPLQPLVWALYVISASVAAGIMALFGLGWIALGVCLKRTVGAQPALS